MGIQERADGNPRPTCEPHNSCGRYVNFLDQLITPAEQHRLVHGVATRRTGGVVAGEKGEVGKEKRVVVRRDCRVWARV